MLSQLFSDIGSLWAKYGTVYLTGIANTLILAITSTLIGCIIGFLCGILQTIPCGPNEHVIKRVLLKLIRIIIRAYVEIFRKGAQRVGCRLSFPALIPRDLVRVHPAKFR